MSTGLTLLRRLEPELQRLREQVLATPPPRLSPAKLDALLTELELERAKLQRVIALRDEVARLRAQATTVNGKGVWAIMDLVSARTSVSVDKIISRSPGSRVESVAWARHLVCYLAREFTDLSLNAIGASLGGRAHGTILNSIRFVEDRCEVDVSSRALVEELKRAARAVVQDNKLNAA